MKLLKTLCALYLMFIARQSMAQEVELVSSIILPKGYVSAELSLALDPTDPMHLMAAILCVDPKAKQATYTTLVYESHDLGVHWQLFSSLQPAKAADPWILLDGRGRVLLCDISEGNLFRLTSQIFDGSDWLPETDHGLGHDHGMLINDQGGDAQYLISTQRKGANQYLYLARKELGSHIFNRDTTIEIFNNADYSAKQPMIRGENIIIPIVLRGSWSFEDTRAVPFKEMSSWLVTVNKKTYEVSAPALVTGRSGSRHHILVEGSADRLYYVYTDKSRQKLEVTMTSDAVRWSLPLLLNDTTFSKDVNLDAAIWHNNALAIVATMRVNDTSYQKYLLSVDPDLKEVKTMTIGPRSNPDESSGWVLRAWPQGGDYCGLIGHPDGSLYVLWSSAQDGAFGPVFAKIRIE